MGLDSDDFIILSFHPRASTTNSHITEVLLANEIYRFTGLVPLWFSFTFDSGYKTNERKDRTPTLLCFENKYITLRSPDKIGAFPISSCKPVTEDELKRVSEETRKVIIENGNLLQSYLDLIQFGHVLFQLRRSGTKKLIQNCLNRLDNVISIYLEAIRESKNLGESLTKMNVRLLRYHNLFLEAIEFDNLIKNFPDLYIDTVKKYPELVYHICRDAKRYPIEICGNKIKSGCGCIFSIDEFIENVGVSFVPSGLMCILLISLFSDYTICGSLMRKYYEENITKSSQISKEIGYETNLRFLTFERNRCVQGYGMYDLVSFLHTMNTLGRNVYLNGSFSLPEDVEEHLNWLREYVKEKNITRRLSDFRKDEELTKYFISLIERSVSRPTLYELTIWGKSISPVTNSEFIHENEICLGNLIPPHNSIRKGIYYSFDVSIMPLSYLPAELNSE
jgi:hypothetical protein